MEHRPGLRAAAIAVVALLLLLAGVRLPPSVQAHGVVADVPRIERSVGEG